MTRPTLIGIILTLNESRHIRACIESLAWTDSVMVVDSLSTDGTQELAEAAGASVIEHPFSNYAQQRNVALEQAPADWVLFVDADERATPELGAEIDTVLEASSKAGWWIPRHNHIFGHRMRATGWYPDYQLRLLRREAAHYDPDRPVHELVRLEGEAGHLSEPLVHYNYETLAQFIDKQRRYLDYDVSILSASGINPRVYAPYAQALRHFWWRFVTLQGWRDSVWGLLLSGMMAYYEMIKVRRVRAIRRGSEAAARAS